MFPGYTTKVSEEIVALSTTISPKKDVIHVTDTTATTAVATIVPPFGGFSGIMVVINRSGNAITTVTTGNIANAVSIPVDQPCVFIFSKLTALWYAGAIS